MTLAFAGLAILLGAVIAARALLGGGPVRTLEAPATAMDLSTGSANNSPMLASDPRDSDFLALANRLDATDFSCALQVSGNGGKSWLPARPVPALPVGAEKCYAPEVAFDGAGTLYYLFMGLAGRGNQPMGVFLTTSTDQGRTFSPPWQVLGPSNFGVRMAIDPTMGRNGRMHLVWLQAVSPTSLGGFGPPPNPIMTSQSDDGGHIFAPPIQVSDSRRERVVAPSLTLGPDHAVHVAYYDLEDDAIDYQGLEGSVWDDTWSIVITTSVDGGQRFNEGVVVDDAVSPSERVMLIFTMPPVSVVADRDRLCVTWSDARRGDPDVFLRCSPDTGRSWASVRRVNDDAVGNGRTQYLPRVALSPQGRVDVIFLDRRADPSNTVNDVVYTYSTDGGRHFSDNLRINQGGSNTLIGQQYANVSAQNQVEFGSRIALVSERSGIVATWPDTRHSARFSTEQDLFVANVDIPRGGYPPGLPAIVGIGLVLIGLLVIGIGGPWPRRRWHRAGEEIVVERLEGDTAEVAPGAPTIPAPRAG